MEPLFSLGIVILVAIPISIVYLLISNAKLKTRLGALEDKFANQTVAAPSPPVPEAQSPVTAPAERSNPWVAAKSTGPEPAQVSTPIEEDEGPPKAVVLTRENVQRLVNWVTQNWFYVVSALSLALAGIFLVLYGVEQGLLPPSVRIMAALAFGGALVAAGEYIRRRFGDTEDSATAFLPSTFSGAGIVTLFGAVLSARLLYNFIGPEFALIGMALVGALALVLGWFYGPFLAAVGVIGAMVAPFVIGGSSDNPSGLLAYFFIIVFVGLAIDTMRRWAWISVISLTLGFAAGLILMLGSGSIVRPYFVIFCAALVPLAIAIPVRRLIPDHTGTPLSLSLLARKKGDGWPEFPTRLAGGTVAATSLLIAFTTFETARADLFWTGAIALSAMVLALLIWTRNAPALSDLAALPAAALVFVVAGGDRIWRVHARAALEPEADMPLMATSLVAIGFTLSLVAVWRSLRGGHAQFFIAVGAALLAPSIAIAMEVFWRPAVTLGAYAWALHAMAIAGLMVVAAERFARVDGPDDRARVSVAVLSALACIAFGVVILFTSAALTTALAITLVAAAWLDRRFNLPLMGLYILAGITTIGYRLVIDPGVEWAIRAPLPEMLLSHAGAVLAFGAAWVLVKSANRPRSEVLLESAVFSSGGILLSLLLYRAILGWGGEDATASHWSFGIGATVWIALGLAQLRRLSIGGALTKVRAILGGLFLTIGALQLAVAVTLLNPAIDFVGSPILGPKLFNTLIPAYLLPAVVLALGARWLGDLKRFVRIALATASILLAALWLALTIRHFWRGAENMSLPDIGQPELYSYTLALLILGAALFYQSLARSNALLRKAGLLVIGLAVAKVFMIDISGLGGLIRVFSLLFLGLALAGLAWLNRWAAGRYESAQDPEET